MTVRRYRKDPRAAAARSADADVLRRFEGGEFLQAESDREREAIEHVQGRYLARRELVATLGKELGVLRRAHGLTQDQVARVVGTNKSNISRLESGRYGGLTVERLIAVFDAFQALGAETQEAAQQAVAADGRPRSPAARSGARG